MILTTLQGTNVKGASFSHEGLAPLSLFCGPNAAGKSSRLDATLIGLVGYHPKLGKRPSDTFLLSSGKEMTVNLVFDTGDYISRNWTKNGERFSLKSDPDDLPVDVSPVLIDPNSFFELSAREQTMQVFQMSPAQDLNVKAVLKVVSEIPQQTPAKSVCENALKSVQASFPDVSGVSAQDWLVSSVEALKQRKNDLSGQSRRLAQGAQTIMETREQDVPNLDTVEAKLKEARTVLERMVQSSANDRATDSVLKEIEAHQMAIAAAKNELVSIETEKESTLSQRICPACGAKKTKKKLQVVIAALDVRIHKANEQISVHRQKLDMAKEKIGDRVPEKGTERLIEQQRLSVSELESLQRRAIAAKSSLVTIQRAAAEREKVDTELAYVKTALAIVESALEQAVAKSFDRVLEIANSIYLSANAKRTPLAYHGEIGMMRDNWISFKTFCGHERLIAYSSIALALASESKFKIVLMDELAVCDCETINELMSNVTNCLKSGMLHQFIGASLNKQVIEGKVIHV